MIKIIKDSFVEHVFNMNKFLYISEVHEIEMVNDKPYDSADQSTHSNYIAYFVSVNLEGLNLVYDNRMGRPSSGGQFKLIYKTKAEAEKARLSLIDDVSTLT